MHSEKSTLGQRLQAEMKKKHVSAQGIAQELGFSRNRIGKILHDELTPDYLTMYGLKAILNLTNEEALILFFGVDERSDNDE